MHLLHFHGRVTQSQFHRQFLTFVIFYFLTKFAFAGTGDTNSGNGSDDGNRLKDPYTTLGVGRRASSTEIRSAYKQLAKEWHPDKNKDPSAQNQFVQINKAYELLSDPDRRRLYDQRGITEDSPNSTPRHDYSSFNQFDPVDEILTFTTGGSFNFPFADGIASLHKQSVTSKTFDQSVLPKSNTIPQLILFYGDWCTGCARAAPAWRTITDDLQGIGMDVLTIHAERERTVSRRMGISAVPAILLLIESQPHHYRESVISPNKVVAFVRSKIPSDVILHIDSSNVDSFLNSWSDNRVRVLIFGTGTSIRLRYMLLAFQFSERAAFGYIYPSDYSVRSRFGVQKAIDTIMVFKEMTKPVASLSMADIPSNLMKDLVENNKYLVLPRLSSQPIMDAICPTETSMYRRRLCVLLLTQVRSSEIEERNSLRDFSMKHAQPRVRFGYVFKDKQEEFFNSLVNGGLRSSSQNLVIVWRHDRKRISYEWIDWDGTNASCQHLESTLHKLLNEKQALAYQIEIKELTDEHAKSLMSKVLNKISLTMDFVRGHLTRELVIQTTSLVATILFIIAGGFIMAYLVRLEEESIAAKANVPNTRERSQTNSNPQSSSRPSNTASSSRSHSHSTSSGSAYSDLRIHEMRGETYNGLVRLIKPGCRTILLLLDADTKNSLLPKFQRCVYPYRKNKSLQFSFMHVDKGGGLRWYKQLLQLSLAEPRNLNINPRNCVGTVLSLNGFRRYFCVFHVTLPGGTPKRNRSSGYRNGGFLGFDSDKSSGEDNSDVESRRQEPSATEHRPSVLFTSHLLDNLSNWLDRLFEGSTHRYHISDDWPEFAIN